MRENKNGETMKKRATRDKCSIKFLVSRIQISFSTQAIFDMCFFLYF